MRYFEKYTGEKTYLFPNGSIGTKNAVLESFPAALEYTFVVETDESKQIMLGMNSIITLKSIYNIPFETTDDDAIAQIQEAANAPSPEPEYTPTAEERTAAALEFLAMNSLPDVAE